jgi:hypothetical protein
MEPISPSETEVNEAVMASPGQGPVLPAKELHYFKGQRLPAEATPMRLLGVDYVHIRTTNGGDLYLTQHGLPYLEHLQLENWRDDLWFEEKRERLKGTSVVYKTPTKKVKGRSIDLVVKYCRVGEDVPLDTLTFERFAHAEFNSPYEEFSLVMELREQKVGEIIRTHRPLAIYVPPERLEPWQTGRSQHRIERKIAKFRDVELDICRQYVLIYEWVKGESADTVLETMIPGAERRRSALLRLTLKAKADLARKGFRVIDHKPAHIILRCRPDGTVLQNRQGECYYALIDFELLQRTPEHEQEIQSSRRAMYLKHQRDRFKRPKNLKYPERLKPVTVFDANFVCGHADSTHGMLWVVGRDPDLFDYFIPERWRRTHGKRLSSTNETYYTLTKDRINLVWKLSRVGEKADFQLPKRRAAEIAAYGYNSPFEEFAIALDLMRKGIDTIYPRAIYMSGLESARAELYVLDNSRYQSHQYLVTPYGQPLLKPNHNYLTIWGFWNGLDEMLAHKDEAYCRGINLQQARDAGIIRRRDVKQLLGHAQETLLSAGYRDLLPKPTHYLLSLRHNGKLILNQDGTPAMRICNFGLIKKIS